MKFYNIDNIDDFFAVVDKCKGRVELVTGEGDRLNLKSKFCQYVAFAKVVANKEISEMEVVAYDPDDVAKLASFMMKGAGISL